MCRAHGQPKGREEPSRLALLKPGLGVVPKYYANRRSRRGGIPRLARVGQHGQLGKRGKVLFLIFLLDTSVGCIPQCRLLGEFFP